MKSFGKILGLFLFATVLFSCEDVFDDNSGVFSAVDNAKGTGTTISVSSLPAAIISYVSTNYPGKSITKAETYATKIEVTLSDGTKLEFTAAGQFIEVSGSSKNNSGGSSTNTKVSDDLKATLPKAAVDYLNANYPGILIVKAEKSNNKYEVKLANRIRVDFDLAGKVLKVKTW